MNFLPEERNRRHSVASSVCSFDWRDHSVTLIDAPGDPNFASDADGALAASDSAILVLSAQDPLKMDAVTSFKAARERSMSVLAVLNKIDTELSDPRGRIGELEEQLDTRVALLQLPIGQGSSCEGYVDLLASQAYRFEVDAATPPRPIPIPEDLAPDVEEARTSMLEAIVEADDRMLELYLERGDLSDEQIRLTLCKGVRTGTVLPVVLSCASQGKGAHAVLELGVALLPAPFEAHSWPAEQSGEVVSVEADPEAPLAVYVFKSITDRYAGMLSLCRVVAGELTTDRMVQNMRTETKERISKLLQLSGDSTQEVKSAGPGAIVAIPKLKDTRTGDTLCDDARKLRLHGPAPRRGLISFAVGAKDPSEEDKVFESLHRLAEEDPCLDLARDARTGEFLLTGLGQLHIEVTLEKLRRVFKVEALLRPPKVPYQETLRGRAEHVEGKLKKQSGGRGQFAVCYLTVEPGPRGSGVEFIDEIVGGAIPRQYIPAVEKGVREACEHGVLAGQQVTDIRVHCVDGKFHSVDSSEMAFKTAGSLGLRAAFQQADGLLLEPVMHLEVTIPDTFVGDIMGDLNARRGRVAAVSAEGQLERIEAEVPMSEVLSYASDLTSMTGGQGSFSLEFSKYEEVPKDIQEKLVAAFAAGEAGTSA